MGVANQVAHLTPGVEAPTTVSAGQSVDAGIGQVPGAWYGEVEADDEAEAVVEDAAMGYREETVPGPAGGPLGEASGESLANLAAALAPASDDVIGVSGLDASVLLGMAFGHLLRGQPLAHAEVAFPQAWFGDQGQIAVGDDRLRCGPGSPEVAGDTTVEGVIGQGPSGGGGLGPADRGQRAVAVALPAACPVPLGLAMTHDGQVDGRHQRRPLGDADPRQWVCIDMGPNGPMLSPMNLPPGQKRVLACFADAEDEGRQASRSEIAELCGYAFPSAVTKHVDALVRKGLLATDRERKRNVEVTSEGWSALARIPVDRGVPVIGAIAAGAPILATEHHTDYLEDIVQRPGRIALRVRGDSMVEAGINDGDYAIVDARMPGQIQNGQIGAVVVGNEATLKVVRLERRRLVLEPRNQAYEPIVIDRKATADECRLVGPLEFIYRRFA